MWQQHCSHQGSHATYHKLWQHRCCNKATTSLYGQLWVSAQRSVKEHALEFCKRQPSRSYCAIHDSSCTP